MKKFLSLSLIIVILLSLVSCASVGEPSRTYEGEAQIPENGIISAADIEAIIANKSVCTFYGYSGDIRYEWMLFGDSITEAKDLNLKTSVTVNDDGSFSIAYSSTEDFGFDVLFDIKPSIAEDIYSYEVYASDGSEKIDDAYLSEGDATAVCFVSTFQHGGVKLVPVFKSAEESSKESTVSETATVTEETATTVTENTTAEKETASPITYSSETVSGQVPSTKQPATEINVTTTKPVTTAAASTQSDVLSCTISIECTSIFSDMDELDPEKISSLPSDGIILKKTTVEFTEGDSVFDVLQKVCRENKIPLEFSKSPVYNSVYIEGIHNLYEFDCGSLSGWMYRVNGVYPGFGCSSYQLKDGDNIEWRYTCDLGKDIGGGVS